MSGHRGASHYQYKTTPGSATQKDHYGKSYSISNTDIPTTSGKASTTIAYWLDVLDTILTSFNNAQDKGNGLYQHLGNLDLKAFAEKWSQVRYVYVNPQSQPQSHTGGREDWVLVEKVEIDKMIDENKSLKETVQAQRSQLKDMEDQYPVEQTQPSKSSIIREKPARPIQRGRPKSSFPDTQQQKLQYIKELEKDREDKVILIGEKKIMEAKIETLTRNISSMMNQAMCRDESDLENINIKNRPMKILGEYESICSDHWLDAKRAVDKYAPGMDEQTKLAKLNNIFMECYETAARVFAHQKTILTTVLQHPVKVTLRPEYRLTQPKQSPSKTESSLKTESPVEKGVWTTDLDVAVSKYLKLNCETADYYEMAKDILSSIFPEREFESVRKSGRIDHFILAVCELSWKMVIQKPAMVFDANDLNFREQNHELHWGSCNERTPGVRITNYVYPALYHGDKIVKKAKVVLGLPGDATKILKTVL